MPPNINMLINLIKSGGNPQNMAMQMLQGMGGNNPILNNVIGMVQNGDTSGIEQIGRNLCKSKGIDPEQMINDIKKQYGL